MKKILIIILVILSYSCCTTSIPTLPPIIVSQKPKPEPKPEPNPEPNPESKPELKSEPVYKMTTTEHNHTIIEKDKIVKSINLKKDGTIIKNNIKTSAINSESPTFDKGNINYIVKDTMIIGVITEVNMTISKGVDIKTIINDVKTFTENNLHSDSIRISPVMRARLIDPSNGLNFIVVSKTNAEQFLEIGDYTRWIWDVTPLNKGTNELSLIVDVMYGSKSKSYQVYDGFIYVYSNETFFQKITKFFIKNWQYILTSLLIPFIGFLYTRYKNKTTK